MQYRKLGRSDVKVSEISFGCWTMGGLNWVNGSPNGWANVNDDEVTTAVKAGLDAGVNHFDNADVYGNGKAEQMLTRVLERLGVVSTSVLIASKVGHFPGTAAHAYEAAHIRHQCEQSLINLKRDYLDIYYFHHGNFGPKDCYLADAVVTMNKLVAEGKVRLVGLSAYSADDFERLVPHVKPTCLQSWAHAMDDQFIRPGSRVANLMAQHGLSFVCFSPLAQGLLLDKFNPDNPPTFDEGDHRRNAKKFTREELLKLKPKLAQLKARFGTTTEDLAAMALNYDLAQPNVACVIPGFRNVGQAVCNVQAAGRYLSPADVDFVRQILAS
jgi:aryl-alcohol dehydrogenase-like predicted oxidoreductase